MVGHGGLEISIHAPREGSDGSQYAGASGNLLFLSTLPARGATLGIYAIKDTLAISIHAPREGSDRPCNGHTGALGNISIHAPREGSDHEAYPTVRAADPFLSTLPARGATAGRTVVEPVRAISIHAPREGSDRAKKCPCFTATKNFYPRSPRGERL